jgi:hypothetical protein
VDVLWFGSLGYGDVFWKTLSLQWGIFAAFAAATFLILYGSFLALKRAHLPDLPSGHTIFIGGQPVKLPVEPVLRLIALGVSLVIALATGAGDDGGVADAGALLVCAAHHRRRCRPDLWQAAELLSVHPAGVATHRRLAADASVITCCPGRFLHPHHGRKRACSPGASAALRPRCPGAGSPSRLHFLLLILAMRVYLGRFEQLFDTTRSSTASPTRTRTSRSPGCSSSARRWFWAR